MDFLDRMNGTGFQTYKGAYYPEMPTLSGIDQTRIDFENPVPFQYEPIDTTRNFGYPVPNIRDTQAEETGIKTKSSMFYGKELGGLVKLQDGQFYEVISCTIDRKSISRQSAEYVKKPVGADYIVRLNKIDNPFIERGFEQSGTYEPEYNISFILQNVTAVGTLPTTVHILTTDTIQFTKQEGTIFTRYTATNAHLTQSTQGNTITINLTEKTGDIVVYVYATDGTKWKFNDVPTWESPDDYEVAFTSNETEYSEILWGDEGLKYGNTVVFNNATEEWANNAYKNIVFDERPTEVGLLNFLRANATPLE